MINFGQVINVFLKVSALLKGTFKEMFPGDCPQEQKDTYLHDQIIYIAQAQLYIIKKETITYFSIS